MTTDNPTTMENEPGQAESTMDKPEMCCDGKQTAEEHRKSSPDGKCCIDG